MFNAKVDLPNEGRAAKTTKSVFCKPESILSKSANPVGNPRVPPPCDKRSIRSNAAGRVSRTAVKF